MNELVDYIEVNVVYDNTLTNYELNNFIINTSIEIDLTGSVLSGKDISCDYDIIKKNTDLFIIEVPYNRLNETITFNIVETTSPTYLQIKKPQMLDFIYENNAIRLLTDKPTKVVVFKNTKRHTNIYSTTNY